MCGEHYELLMEKLLPNTEEFYNDMLSINEYNKHLKNDLILDVLNTLSPLNKKEDIMPYLITANSPILHEKLNRLGVSSEVINKYMIDNNICISSLAFSDGYANSCRGSHLIYNSFLNDLTNICSYVEDYSNSIHHIFNPNALEFNLAYQVRLTSDFASSFTVYNTHDFNYFITNEHFPFDIYNNDEYEFLREKFSKEIYVKKYRTSIGIDGEEMKLFDISINNLSYDDFMKHLTYVTEVMNEFVGKFGTLEERQANNRLNVIN